MTLQERIDLKEEAMKNMVQLLPPEQYGEDERCELIQNALEDLTSIDIPMEDEVMWILGRPVYQTLPIAHRLRDMGHDIDRKMEKEQAAAIHYMLSLYFKHGAPQWREELEKELNVETDVSKTDQK